MAPASSCTAKCPRCGHELWAMRDGEWTLQNRIVKLDEHGQIVAKCHECRSDVRVPFLRFEPPPAPAAPVPGARVRAVVRLDSRRAP